MITQADIDSAVAMAARALETVSADSMAAIAHLAGQVLLAQELRRVHDEQAAIPYPIDGGDHGH